MQPLDDERFWEMVDEYERGELTVEDAIKEICSHTKSYSVATADLALLVKRTLTKDEKSFINECLKNKKGK